MSDTSHHQRLFGEERARRYLDIAGKGFAPRETKSCIARSSFDLG